MDKKIITLCIILFLSGIGNSQPVTQQNTGIGIQLLIEAIQNNTRVSNQVNKEIEDLPVKFEEQLTKYGSLTIFGTSVFLLFLYSSFIFLEHIRKRRNKKTREEYIKELNNELRTIKEQYLKDLEKLHEVHAIIHRLKTLSENAQSFENKKIRMLLFYGGVLVGLLISSAIYYGGL